MRNILRHPEFFAFTVLTLAVGIGAMMAIFDVIYAVFLRVPARRAARTDRTNALRNG